MARYTEEERRQMQYQDNENFAMRGIHEKLPKCKVYSEKKIRKLTKDGIEKFYVDCSDNYINVPGFYMSSVYTPYGIKMIDSWFCREIRSMTNGESKFTRKKLIKAILTCPHLHPIIRSNLYLNCKVY